MIRHSSKRRRCHAGGESLNFVIICTSADVTPLITTVESIRKTYPKSGLFAMASKSFPKDKLKTLHSVCEVVEAEDTITSQINLGMKHSQVDWNVIVFAGSWVGTSLYRQITAFAKSEDDVLFQVVDGRYNFVEASLHGLVMHRRGFTKVGDFPESKVPHSVIPEMELLKLRWALVAIEKGIQLKGIVGMPV